MDYFCRRTCIPREQDRKAAPGPAVFSDASEYSISPGEILSVRNITFVVFRIFFLHSGLRTE